MTFVRFGFLLAGSASAAGCGGAGDGKGYKCTGTDVTCDGNTCTAGQWCIYAGTCADETAVPIASATAAADGAAATVAKQACSTTTYCLAKDNVCLVQDDKHQSGETWVGATLSGVAAQATKAQCIAPAAVRCHHATHVQADSDEDAKISKLTYAARDICTKLKPNYVADGATVPCAVYKFADFEQAKPTSSASTNAKWKHTGKACITDCCKITGDEAKVKTACEADTDWCTYDTTAKKCENKKIADSITLAEKGCLPEATSAANVKASSLGAAVVLAASILLA